MGPELLHSGQMQYLVLVGRRGGTADVVVELLERRFGRLPEFVKERVKQLAILDMREIAGRTLTAQNLHEALDIEPLRPRPRESESEE